MEEDHYEELHGRETPISKIDVQLVKEYSFVNTTKYSFIVSRYSIDDKIHVSAQFV
jgi:hypothetical protein